jgi:hypothetical protein
MPDNKTYCSTFWDLYQTFKEAEECNDEVTAAEYSQKMDEHRKTCRLCSPPREADK